MSANAQCSHYLQRKECISYVWRKTLEFTQLTQCQPVENETEYIFGQQKRLLVKSQSERKIILPFQATANFFITSLMENCQVVTEIILVNYSLQLLAFPRREVSQFLVLRPLSDWASGINLHLHFVRSRCFLKTSIIEIHPATFHSAREQVG